MSRSLSPTKKAALMAAALNLFVTRGVANTSTAQIAAEAGVAAGTLFLYFPTKQHLLDELTLQIGRQQSEHITALLEPGFSTRQTFYTIWHGTLAWFLENMPAFLFLQQVRHSGLISPTAIEQSSEFFGYYYTAIQKGLEEDTLKPYPLGLVGEFLYQDLVAVMNYLRAQSNPAERERIIQQGFEIYWAGIQKETKA